MPAPGDTLDLRLQLSDGQTGKFPLAHVFDASGVEIAGSPVALTHVARGLYINGSLIMPSTDQVFVQYISYDDSLHIVQSADEIISLDVFRNLAPTSGKIILGVQLWDGNTGKFPQAHVFNPNNSELSGSPVNLTHIARGLYINGSLTFPANDVTAQYVVYDDSLHTIQSADQTISMDEIRYVSPAVISTDPGVQNVKFGVSYEILGVPLIGIFIADECPLKADYESQDVLIADFCKPDVIKASYCKPNVLVAEYIDC